MRPALGSRPIPGLSPTPGQPSGVRARRGDQPIPFHQAELSLRSLADHAEGDLLAAGEGTVEPSAEYSAVVRRLTIVGSLLSLLVLVTILFMAIKP